MVLTREAQDLLAVLDRASWTLRTRARRPSVPRVPRAPRVPRGWVDPTPGVPNVRPESVSYWQKIIPGAYAGMPITPGMRKLEERARKAAAEGKPVTPAWPEGTPGGLSGRFAEPGQALIGQVVHAFGRTKTPQERAQILSLLDDTQLGHVARRVGVRIPRGADRATVVRRVAEEGFDPDTVPDRRVNIPEGTSIADAIEMVPDDPQDPQAAFRQRFELLRPLSVDALRDVAEQLGVDAPPHQEGVRDEQRVLATYIARAYKRPPKPAMPKKVKTPEDRRQAIDGLRERVGDWSEDPSTLDTMSRDDLRLVAEDLGVTPYMSEKVGAFRARLQRVIEHRRETGFKPGEWEEVDPAALRQEALAKVHAALARRGLEPKQYKKVERQLRRLVDQLFPEKPRGNDLVMRNDGYTISVRHGVRAVDTTELTRRMDKLITDHPEVGPVSVTVLPERRMHKYEGKHVAGYSAWAADADLHAMVLSDDLWFHRDQKSRRGHFMPQAQKKSRAEYVIAHEFGHLLPGDVPTDIDRTGMSSYGRETDLEAQAEAFAEWHLSGGRTRNGAARRYAERLGWPGAEPEPEQPARPTKKTPSAKKAAAKKAAPGKKAPQPPDYPDRQTVPAGKRSWDVDMPDYDPPEYTSQVVLDQDRTKVPGGWADPPDPSDVDREFTSDEGPVRVDEQGRPLNPHGRTGLRGRGRLGKWGANPAADPILTRENPETGEVELLVVKRLSGEWALPGGMVDPGETPERTATRELGEETGVDVDMSAGRLVRKGYVDDPRNTDNAWMESRALHRHLTGEDAARAEPTDVAVKAGEILEVRWQPVTDEFLDSMYAGHGDFVRQALGPPPRKAVKKTAKKATPRKATKRAPAAEESLPPVPEGQRRLNRKEAAAARRRLEAAGPGYLRDLLEQQGLDTSGRKPELVKRLLDHMTVPDVPEGPTVEERVKEFVREHGYHPADISHQVFRPGFGERIDAAEGFDPSEFKPGQWRFVGATEESAGGIRSRTYENGPHQIVVLGDIDLTPDQLAEVQSTLDDFLPRLPLLRPYRFVIERRHRESQHIRGDIRLAYEAFTHNGQDDVGHHMPEVAKHSYVRYHIAHELGHAMDYRLEVLDSDDDGLRERYWKSLSRYGHERDGEAYAEAFAEWLLSDGKTDNAAAKAYAQTYGWSAVVSGSRDAAPAKPAKKAAKKAPAAKAPGRRAEGRRDLVDDRKAMAELAQVDPEGAVKTRTPEPDRTAQEIARRQGFDGPPQVVDSEEMDRLVAEGAVREMFRGARAEDPGPAEIHRQFREGSWRIGHGVEGSGTYMATEREPAEVYAEGAPEAVARYGLRTDARTISGPDLLQQYEQWLKDTFGEPEPPWEELSKDPRFIAYGDPGRWAMAHGYDAVIIPPHTGRWPKNFEQILILNRTAVVAEAPKGAPAALPARGSLPNFDIDDDTTLAPRVIAALDKWDGKGRDPLKALSHEQLRATAEQLGLSVDTDRASRRELRTAIRDYHTRIKDKPRAKDAPAPEVAGRIKVDRPAPRSRGPAPSPEPRKALTAARSIAELNDTARAEAKRITGRDIPFDFSGADLQVSREHAEGILRGLEAFPAARLTRVRMGDMKTERRPRHVDDDDEGVYALTRTLDDGSYEIIFSVSHSSPDGVKSYREGLDATGQIRRVGRGLVTRTPMGIALHELGHVVDLSVGDGALGRIATRMADDHMEAIGYRRDAVGTLLERRAAIARRNAAFGFIISRYAMENGREMGAEVFADVMEHGDDAAELSRAIFDAFEDELKEARR